MLKLEAIELVPGPGTLTWRPVRHALGVRAFGCNAHTAHDVHALEVHPDSPSLLYELACLAAIVGAHEDALATLKRGIAIKPEIRSWAREDEDFRTLHQDRIHFVDS